jgi:hypothetical protein
MQLQLLTTEGPIMMFDVVAFLQFYGMVFEYTTAALLFNWNEQEWIAACRFCVFQMSSGAWLARIQSRICGHLAGSP